MRVFEDVFKRKVRLTDERYEHLVSEHPEMVEQIDKVKESLFGPVIVVRSKADSQFELFYRYYKSTPVTQKYWCIVVKVRADDSFIITAYFTDTIKKGKILWEKK